MLQEAVDAAVRQRPPRPPGQPDLANRPLKSLSDLLKGQAGAVPPEPAGRSVSTTPARSVIVVGPQLKLQPVRPAEADGAGAVQAVRV